MPVNNNYYVQFYFQISEKHFTKKFEWYTIIFHHVNVKPIFQKAKIHHC